MEYTVRQLIAEIRDVAAQLDPNHLPTGLTKLRKTELELLLSTLRTDLQIRLEREERERQEALFAAEEQENVWYDDPTGDIAAPDGLGQRDPNEGIDEWHALMDELTNSQVDGAFGAEVDALVARELRDDVPTGLVERVQFAARLPIMATNVEVSNVAVVVQSGSRLLWGKLINVVNRRTRYSAPLLVTVEVDGHRQLVAADDILAA